jgi:hypothetical protein
VIAARAAFVLLAALVLLLVLARVLVRVGEWRWRRAAEERWRLDRRVADRETGRRA